MAYLIVFIALVCCSCDTLHSEGSSVIQINSTQSNSTVVRPSSSQIISPSSQSSTLSAPLSSTPSKSFANTINSSKFAVNPSTSAIKPTSTTSIIPSPLSQINNGQRPSDGKQAKYIILPPEQERRDFNLIANTRLHWVRYLLDQSSPEFSALKEHVEVYLYETFKDVPGFVKTEVTEFQEEKFAFYAIIYTRKSARVSENAFEAALGKAMFSTESNDLNIYAFDVSPRFTEMPYQRGSLLAPPPKRDAAEDINCLVNFIQGFVAMLAFIIVFVSIGFIKYKVCNHMKNQDSDQKSRIHESHAKDVSE